MLEFILLGQKKKIYNEKNPSSAWKAVAKCMSQSNPCALKKIIYSVMKDAPATEVV